MATAVVRVVVDPDGALTLDRFAAGIAHLRQEGLEVIQMPTNTREVELIIEEPHGTNHLDLCSTAFGVTAEQGVVTYISRGTDEDAHGVLQRFGFTGRVERDPTDEDQVTVTLRTDQRRVVPESRLLTALEAALNCEVRIRFV